MEKDMQYVVMPIEDYQNACNEIRKKLKNETILIPSGELSYNIENVYNAGHENGINEHEKKKWDIYQSSGKRSNYANAFFGLGWTDETYNPQYSIISTFSSNLFGWSYITNTKVPIKISDTAAASSVFGNSKKLISIPVLDINDYNYTYSNWFSGCEELRNISIIGFFKKSVDFKDSVNLTKESIINIINALDPTGLLGNELTLNLSLAAVNKAFEEIDSNNNIIIGSMTDSWKVLVKKRNNWKILLV